MVGMDPAEFFVAANKVLEHCLGGGVFLNVRGVWMGSRATCRGAALVKGASYGAGPVCWKWPCMLSARKTTSSKLYIVFVSYYATALVKNLAFLA